MGPVNWLAVFLAAAGAAIVLRLFWRGPEGFRGSLIYLLPIIPAAMLGHALARIGTEKLTAKPQLYAMQAGGLALAIVLPMLWMGYARHGIPVNERWRDSAAIVLAFLTMGGVFWGLG